MNVASVAAQREAPRTSELFAGFFVGDYQGLVSIGDLRAFFVKTTDGTATANLP